MLGAWCASVAWCSVDRIIMCPCVCACVCAGRIVQIPGALQSLRFSIQVYGNGSIELVPSYLLLAEANLGLGRFKQAEEFLSLANWSVLKRPDCSNAMRSQLHRNFGKLYAAQGRSSDALRELSHDVYYSSLEIGPEHVDSAPGYFYMATIFYSQHLIENALALFDKVG